VPVSVPVPVLTNFAAAFQDFLKSYKSSSTEAADALQDLNLEEDGDGLSDEYDFMEDADGDSAGQRTRRREKHPKLKYMQMLQDVADRKQSHILIELDDLDTVRPSHTPQSWRRASC
jgi:DNA replication licensing factor MCM7